MKVWEKPKQTCFISWLLAACISTRWRSSTKKKALAAHCRTTLKCNLEIISGQLFMPLDLLLVMFSGLQWKDEEDEIHLKPHTAKLTLLWLIPVRFFFLLPVQWQMWCHRLGREKWRIDTRTVKNTESVMKGEEVLLSLWKLHRCTKIHQEPHVLTADFNALD